ncbi:MAG: NAD(P)H-dependent oxidoreductase [Enterovibrio sp.]
MVENKKNKVLVLLAHPSQRRSQVNLPLFNMAKSISGVTAVDLYAEYPTYHIDIDKEQRRLLDHDIILFQFPLYWYSTPSILKEWQDLVLEYNFAYGSEGTKLKGKYFMCAISAGGKEDVYQRNGDGEFNIRELLLPLERMTHVTGMKFLAPFVLFGARSATEDGKIGLHINSYRTLLLNLVHNKVKFHSLARREFITSRSLNSIFIGNE